VVDALGEAVSFYKVGLELFAAAGPAAVAAVAATAARVFLDLKLHDIPETVARATRAAARGGASLLTVHAAGGAQMLQRAAGVAREEGLRLLAVTVLTSQGEEALREDGITGTVAQAVLRRATLAVAAGVVGLAFAIGIGLNYGPAVLGDVGSEHSLSFTVIGDTVNVASRLQSLTRELKTPLVVGDAVVTQIGGGTLPLALKDGGERELRGRSGTIRIWTPAG
jgi:orotidine-5'-phosphate decarboxylase